MWKTLVPVFLLAAVPLCSGYTLKVNNATLTGQLKAGAQVTLHLTMTNDGFMKPPQVYMKWNEETDPRNSFTLCPASTTTWRDLKVNNSCIVDNYLIGQATFTTQIPFYVTRTRGQYKLTVMAAIFWYDGLNTLRTFTLYTFPNLMNVFS